MFNVCVFKQPFKLRIIFSSFFLAFLMDSILHAYYNISEFAASRGRRRNKLFGSRYSSRRHRGDRRRSSCRLERRIG